MKIIYIRLKRYEEARTQFLSEMNKAFLEGETIVEVVHGIGTFALKNMVLNETEKLNFAKILTVYSEKNPGITRIELFPPDKLSLLRYLSD